MKELVRSRVRGKNQIEVSQARSIDYIYDLDQMTMNGFGDGKWSSINPGGESCETLIMTIIRIRQIWMKVEVRSA